MKIANRGSTRKLLEPLLLAASGLLCSRLGSSGVAATSAAHAPLHRSAGEQLLFVYAIVFALLAVASFVVGRRGLSLSGLIFGEYKAEISGFAAEEIGEGLGRNRLLALLFLVLVAIAVRLAFLDQPMRYDESASFLVFVNERISHAFYYPVPNNHVLNTLLERLSCAVLGGSPTAIRLPAFLAGVALVPAVHSLCRKIEPRSGLLAAAGAAAMPFMVLYSTNGRGYTLLCLLTVLLLSRLMRAGGREVSCRWGIPALVSALGMWVMPSMLFVIASVGLWVAASLALDSNVGPRRAFAYASAYGGATAVLTLMLYTPVVLASDGFGSLLSNRFVQSLPTQEFFRAIVPHWIETIRDFSRDIPRPTIGLALVLAGSGLFIAMRRGQRALALLLPAFFIGTTLVFLAKRSIPFARTWIYLIPVVLVCADVAAHQLSASLGERMRTLLAAIACCGATAVAGFIVATGAIVGYPDTGAFLPAKDAAAKLAPLVTSGDQVCAQLPADAPTVYYLWRDIPQSAYAARSAQSVMFFVDDARRNFVTSSDGTAHFLIGAPGYTLYEWNGAGGVPGSACWWPALLPNAEKVGL